MTTTSTTYLRVKFSQYHGNHYLYFNSFFFVVIFDFFLICFVELFFSFYFFSNRNSFLKQNFIFAHFVSYQKNDNSRFWKLNFFFLDKKRRDKQTKPHQIQFKYFITFFFLFEKRRRKKTWMQSSWDKSSPIK